MAISDHVKILSLGVTAWNEWRQRNRQIVPDLSFGEFGRSRFADIDFENTNLHAAVFNDSDLTRARLNDAILTSANFCNANLKNSELGGVNAEGANFHNATLVLVQATGANLQGAVFDNARVEGGDFYFTNLSEARFYDATLLGVELGGANLQRAIFNGATIAECFMEDADFEGAILGWTIISGVDLSNAKGLEKVIHQQNTTIGIDTIYKSNGKIPESFLRESGVPENFITYMHSLTASAIEFYKCFISYSEADDKFSELLYSDLQDKGVRCWRWREDAPWGKTLLKSIDEAIRVYDKLVVICSKDSLKSPAVIREIERALQREDDLGKKGRDNEVLFPIRLDNYIFSDWEHYRKADVLVKNIGDFIKWKDPTSYRKALDRLVRDLRTGHK